MTREENIRAVLECVFSQSREDLIDIAVNGIMKLKNQPCEVSAETWGEISGAWTVRFAPNEHCEDAISQKENSL